MTLNSVELASEEVRQSNRKAIIDRNKWRDQYYILTMVIRNIKARRANNPDNCAIQLEYHVMRSYAASMMEDRVEIRNELRESAYKWV